MNCFRCGKEIAHPDNTNADYVMAEDTKGINREEKIVVVALFTNDKIKEKLKNDEVITIDDFDAVEVKEAEDVLGAKSTYRKTVSTEREVQKTGIVCPDCYKPSDLLIWGIHKE